MLAVFALTAGDWVSSVFARGWQGPQALARLSIVAATTGVALWCVTRLYGRGRSVYWLVGGLGAGGLTWAAVL